MDKRRVTTALAKYVVNPFAKHLAGRVGWLALLETIGRKSGEPRLNPVGNGQKGNTFWIVAEHGARANYVKNLTANPRVRVKAKGKWYTGTATTMPEDDTDARLRTLSRFNGWIVRAAGTDKMTIRIDLDPGSARPER
jgi:deazaflavin-dependent oxidoreductase (nitroreductase family)